MEIKQKIIKWFILGIIKNDNDDDNCYDDGNSTMSFIHHPSFKNL